eukprot:5590775-Pyramimonas_sp.AAC.1
MAEAEADHQRVLDEYYAQSKAVPAQAAPLCKAGRRLRWTSHCSRSWAATTPRIAPSCSNSKRTCSHWLSWSAA